MDSGGPQRWVIGAVVGAALVLPCGPSQAGAARGTFKGPVEASVIEVLDGDTFLAEAHVWPGHSVTVNIRIRGIDAPEMKSRCSEEHAAALRARAALDTMIANGSISLTNIAGAKYYGRVLADVATRDGLSVGALLLARDLVRPYQGGKRGNWCR